MITGVLRIDPETGEDIPLQMVDYFYSWFIVETIKTIVLSGGNYSLLAAPSNTDLEDIECSSVSYVEVFVEQLMDMYYQCHNSSLNSIQSELEQQEEIEIVASVTLNQYLGDLHYQTFQSLLGNNSYQEFLNIVNEIGGVDVTAYRSVVQPYGRSLTYTVTKDATDTVFRSLMN